MNTVIYAKNYNPKRYKKTGKIKVGSKHNRLDLVEISKSLDEGKIRELEVYRGDNQNKLKTRLIIYKITEELSEKRQYQKNRIFYNRTFKLM